MGRRQDFHEILVKQYEGLIYDDHIVNPCVKYQPGPSVTLNYPAIIYKLNDMPSNWANNWPYHWEHRYEVQVIDRKADSPLRERLISLQMCKFRTSYTVDNLYHFVFDIFY